MNQLVPIIGDRTHVLINDGELTFAKQREKRSQK
jgi:hypothetical protein